MADRRSGLKLMVLCLLHDVVSPDADVIPQERAGELASPSSDSYKIMDRIVMILSTLHEISSLQTDHHRASGG